ncbi:MAG: 50S ribosomal protein L21 [Clostridiales bacterium]|jgi:large subunit ribosomal protein L21|nr:50S ribosomal protein L21 [Clostridiales bacterium]
MYAIIETGGKQFKVSEGDIIKVEKLGAAAGDAYDFNNVMLVTDGDAVTCGTPYISGASVSASILGDGKEKKVIVYKYKSKKGFHKKKGHRQPFTTVRIDKISL